MEFALKDLCEIIMLVCFGAAWPLSVYKSWTSRTSRGKSLMFLVVIITGYLAGIGKCYLGGTHPWVRIMYFVNIFMVSCDVVLYFRNAALDKIRDKADKTNQD